MREWNADSYHQVSTPQFDWGLVVLDRLSLEGHELVFDIGCGTGRLTEKVLERLPRGRVVGIDMSSNMLQVARDFLRPRFDRQIQFVMADAAALPMRPVADAIFSTATFHWVRDHPQLFRSLYAALKPGGRVVAQCGGGANIAQQYLQAGLVDEIQIHLIPVLLGVGIRLFDHLDTNVIELEKTKVIDGAGVTHLRFQILK